MPLQLYEREQILNACLSVFARHGYKDTSTGMLAEAAGISKALIFHHFKSKKNLYFNLLEYCYGKVGSALQADTVSQYEDFFQAVTVFMRNKFDYYCIHSNESKLVFEAFYCTPDELKEDKNKIYSSLLNSKNQDWERLFDKVVLREGVDRNEAFEFIMNTLGYFENKFFVETIDVDVINEEYVQNLLAKMIRYCDMIHYGIIK
ncbi:TetR/AcrR family transcriptional regulator [Paenibacillus sp. GSMTC-2017]|nr:TetR/AcrR family transcriptional regulator [Paenibacillus sp. GSMTC-2017]